MSEPTRDWNERYVNDDTPWDSGEPSRELRRVISERGISPCRMLELGCGTGTNAVYLAQQGFEVTACDISELAIQRAKERSAAADAPVNFIEADVVSPPDFGNPFPFVFDRGTYHVVRQNDLAGFLRTVERVTEPGSLWLTLAGNANQTEPVENGPPTVRAVEICGELEPLFDLVQLREFRFDGVVINGQDVEPMAWSVLLRRR